MGDDDRLRIGGWVPQSGEAAGPARWVRPASDPTWSSPVIDNLSTSGRYVDGPPVGGLSASTPVVMPDDPADGSDPWELLQRGGHPGRYRGRRRSGRQPRHGMVGTTSGYKRRIVVVVAAVGAALVGTGALARTLPDRPVALPAPPSAAPADVAADPDRSRLGSAPSPTVAVPSTASPAPEPSPPPLPPPAVPDQTGPPATNPPTDPPATVAPPVTLSYDAEAAELSGFVRLFAVEDASRGEVVGMIGTGQANHVRFTEVTVDGAGEYELTLYYVSAPARDGMVSVNDGEPTTVEFPSVGNWRDIGKVTVPVELAAGTNVIWFGNLTGPAPALDRITVAG